MKKLKITAVVVVAILATLFMAFISIWIRTIKRKKRV